MGCECLGPRRSNEEVYIKLIRQIHNEYPKAIEQELKSNDPYTAIMEKLSKKGQLRKLTDNLSSRRPKIQQALTFNYKLSTPTKQLSHLPNFYLGLIISNSITEIIYPKRFPLAIDLNEKSDQSSNMSLQHKNSLSKVTENTGKKVIKGKNNGQGSVGEAVDEQFLKLAGFLYEVEEGKLRRKVLESVNGFCERQTGLISCEAELWNLITKLLQDLKTNPNPEPLLQTLKNLLTLTRPQVTPSLRNKDLLETLLLLWLQEQENLNPSSTKQNCFLILALYFERFISAWESEFLFQCVFGVFDSIEFQNVRQGLLEKLGEDLVQGEELRGNFLRMFFGYLLGYLSISDERASNRRELMTSLGIKIQNIKSLYKNALHPKTKIQALKRMNAWIDKKYVDFSEFCLYNNKAIIYVYTSVLLPYLNDKEIGEKILEEFRKTIGKLSGGLKEAMTETAIQEYQEEDLSVKEQQSMSVLIRELLQDNLKAARGKNSQFISSLWFIPIASKQPHEKKLQIIKFNTYLLSILDLSQKNDESVDKIADLMHSFYENIVNQANGFEERYEILQRHQEFLGKMNYRVDNLVVLAYYHLICDKSNQNTKVFSIETQFFLLILGFTLRTLLTGQPLPEKLQNLQKTLQTQTHPKSPILPQLNLYFFNPDSLTKSLIPTLPDSSLQLSQHIKTFTKIFNTATLDRLDSVDRREGLSKISKRNSLSSEIKTQRSFGENDRSFQDAIQIINMK